MAMSGPRRWSLHIQGYELLPELVRSPPANIVRNVPNSNSEYWTWDITATRRFSRRWSLVAGFSHTWNYDQAGAYSGQSVRQNTYALTPNDLINAGKDGRYEFRTWSARIYGTYRGPLGPADYAIYPTPVRAPLRPHVRGQVELCQRADSRRTD